MSRRRRHSPTKALPLEVKSEQRTCESLPVLGRTPPFNQQPQLQPFEKNFLLPSELQRQQVKRYISPPLGNANAKEGPPLHTVFSPIPYNLIRQTWLHYYNDYLRKKQIITEEEWRKMRRLIERS